MVLSTRNIIIGLLAVSLSVFISCISRIALRPSGVAALSSPSMLAEKFMKIEPNTGLFLGISGNSLEKNGEVSRAKIEITPPRSPIFIKPSQRERTPVSPSEISKAVFAEANEEFIISDQIDKFPPVTVSITATIKATKKNPNQI